MQVLLVYFLCTSQQSADGVVLVFRNSSFTAWLAGRVSWTQLSKPAVLATCKGKRIGLEFEPLKASFCLAGWVLVFGLVGVFGRVL